MPPSTKDRIISAIEREIPADQEGWRAYDLGKIYNALSDKGRDNIQVQLSELLRSGRLEGRKSGRNWTHVRLARQGDPRPSVEEIRNGSKSQTERMLHYLHDLANEKGEIPESAADPQHLQRALKFRDYHDVNKALHNLNKLGILSFRESNIGSQGRDHRLTKLRLRYERQKSWPIDMLTDEELPGSTDPEEITEVANLGPSEMEDLVEATGEDFTRGESEVPIAVDDDTTSTLPVRDVFDPDEFPGIAEAVQRHLRRAQAVRLLDDAGDSDISDLVAEKVREENPLMTELVRLCARIGYYG